MLGRSVVCLERGARGAARRARSDPWVARSGSRRPFVPVVTAAEARAPFQEPCERTLLGPPALRAPVSDAPPRALLASLVALAIASISTAAILIRLSDAPPLTIAAYRLGFATLLLAVPALLHAPSRRDLARLPARDLLGLAVVGIVLALHFWSWIASLERTTVAASVVLVTLHPVFVGLVSARLYGEGLSGRGWSGVALALSGGLLIALVDQQQGTHALLGDALALIGALAAALYFLAGRGYRKRLSLLAYVVPVYAASTVTLVALALAFDAPLTGLPARELGLFLAMALVPMILGHTLLNYALRFVTAPVIATTVLGEPVGSTLLAVLILSEVPPMGTLAGGALVLAGIVLVVRQQRLAREDAAADA